MDTRDPTCQSNWPSSIYAQAKPKPKSPQPLHLSVPKPQPPLSVHNSPIPDPKIPLPRSGTTGGGRHRRAPHPGAGRPLLLLPTSPPRDLVSSSSSPRWRWRRATAGQETDDDRRLASFSSTSRASRRPASRLLFLDLKQEQVTGGQPLFLDQKREATSAVLHLHRPETPRTASLDQQWHQVQHIQMQVQRLRMEIHQPQVQLPLQRQPLVPIQRQLNLLTWRRHLKQEQLNRRMHTSWLALYGPLYGPEAAIQEVARVKQLLRDLLVEYQDASSAGTSNVASASQPTAPASHDEVFDIFERYMSAQPTTSSLLVHTELDMYLEEPTLPRTADFDIINWWKFGGIKYPTLQLIAHDIFPIPVTTVASESAFSTSGRILSPHRSRLAPKMVEAIMCMQAWSNADILGENNSSLFSEFQTCLDDEDEPMDEELSTCNNY